MSSFLSPLYILEIRPASRAGTHLPLQMDLLSTVAGRLIFKILYNCHSYQSPEHFPHLK